LITDTTGNPSTATIGKKNDYMKRLYLDSADALEMLSGHVGENGSSWVGEAETAT